MSKTHESCIYQISQEQLNLFANLSDGNGKIHIDPEYAKTTPFGKTLVHGLYLLALIEKELCTLFSNWNENGVLEITFIKPVMVDEPFNIRFEEENNEAKVSVIKCGHEVIAGKAYLRQQS